MSDHLSDLELQAAELRAAKFQVARGVVAALTKTNTRIVCAESCTGGGISAALCAVPGVSAYHCGGFVVYRNASKRDWLGVSEQLLNEPGVGPVSAPASRAICQAALERTSEADWALGITGDVGPGASTETDGRAFVCITRRAEEPPFNFELVTPHQFTPNCTEEDVATIRTLRLDDFCIQTLTLAAQVISEQ